MAASGMIGVGAVIALLALVASQSSTGDSVKTDTKPPKTYNDGLLDGQNDCTNGLPFVSPSTASADYQKGYADGYKSCSAPGPGPTPPSYTCITASAGMTLAQAQTALSSLGYAYDEAIGTCGPSTIAAVKKFQANKGLTADGLIGPATANALKNAANAGSTTTYNYTDSNGIVWFVQQVASTLWRGTPQNYTTPIYNTHLEADTAAHLKASIDAFAYAAKDAVSSGGRRGAHGRPHSPLARRDQRPMFPPYARMM